MPGRHLDAAARADGQARTPATARSTTWREIERPEPRAADVGATAASGHTACNPILDTLKRFRPAYERRLRVARLRAGLRPRRRARPRPRR
ncbi:MAG: hypothetical protein MZV70_33910 [Desulfobacterales bacterium]|nr:hypothetical protein [Desulfobacterales bacterium]